MDEESIRNQERVEELKKEAKPLYELVEEEEFDVIMVKSLTSGTTIETTGSPLFPFGQTKPMKEGEYTNYLILDVDPKNSEIPIEKLAFGGTSNVEKGKRIRAKIPRYEEKEIIEPKQNVYDSGRRTLYLPRDYREEETAIEICKLSSDSEILRRDKSVNYDWIMSE